MTLSLIRQPASKTWPIMTGPVVISVPGGLVSNNAMINIIRQFAGNRDGPLIFHLCGGRPNVTGPPSGTGPPEIVSSGTGPPKKTGRSMEWLVAKKNLNRS